MKFLIKIICFSIFLTTINTNGQFWKKKGGKQKKDIYECGYVKKASFLDKVNPIKVLKNQLGKGAASENSNMSTKSISIYYQAHLHPESIMNFVTKTAGWETCGDAVYIGITGKNGKVIGSTSGIVSLEEEGKETIVLEPAGWGTYFQGFNDSKRGKKTVSIVENNGKKIKVKVTPAAPLTIKTIDGKAKGNDVLIDGTKDIVIELENGDADLSSNLHVQMVCKLTGTPVIYDVIVTKAKNVITIPKEAFKNFEGSPAPFSKNNTLIVNRVVETIEEGEFAKDAGALRTISAYMDWAPVTIEGDIAKGSIITAGFDESKNTKIDINLSTVGEYNFEVNKSNPYNSPPIKLIKNVAIASFIIKGNLSDKGVSADGLWWQEKYFPEFSDEVWQKLVEKMYLETAATLSKEMAWNILPLNKVVKTEAYKHIKPIKRGASKKFVEVGAGNTQRILTTSSGDFYKDFGVTFPGDFVSQRLIKELGVDAVIAITIDLDFKFKTESIDPRITMVAFAPDVSYKTSANYFTMSASTKAKPLSESRQYKGGLENVIYQMIKADTFNSDFIKALKKLSKKEDEFPIYEKLWKAKF